MLSSLRLRTKHRYPFNTYFNIVLESTANIIKLKINLKYINWRRDKAVFVAGMISYAENLAESTKNFGNYSNYSKVTGYIFTYKS